MSARECVHTHATTTTITATTIATITTLAHHPLCIRSAAQEQNSLCMEYCRYGVGTDDKPWFVVHPCSVFHGVWDIVFVFVLLATFIRTGFFAALHRISVLYRHGLCLSVKGRCTLTPLCGNTLELF